MSTSVVSRVQDDDDESRLSGNNFLEPLTKKKEKGGFKAASFVYVLMTLEGMALVATFASLVLYFTTVMHFDISRAANTFTNLIGSSLLLTLVGGLISDTYLTQYTTCLLFGLLEVVAYAMMTIQAHSPSLLPPACHKSNCVEGGVALMFYTSISLLALGSGAMKGSVLAFGANQFDQKDPKEAMSLSTYFNHLLITTNAGSIVAHTVIVWVFTSKGWWLGFLICTVLTSVGYICLALGKPTYRIKPPRDSPIIRILQVIVVSFKNRKMQFSENVEELYENNLEEEKISLSYQFRFFDKAAIIPKATEPSPWNVCTVTQVEEVKILTRMLPIIASTVLMNTCLAQLQTFSVQQGNIMDRSLGSFQVPAPSIPVIPLIFIAILLPIYEYIFIPFAQKITGHPTGITQLQRVGAGLVLSAIAMSVAALVEKKRKYNFIKNPTSPISLFWLSFQYGIFGVANMFTLVGLLEFFYTEAPSAMSSLSTSFTHISVALGYYLSSIFVDIVNFVTRRVAPSKQGWLEGQDLNQFNLDLFYWLLAIVSCLNFGNYLYWASWYKYKTKKPKNDAQVMLLSS